MTASFEIERKFLVPNLRELPALTDWEAIRQGYVVIGDDGTELRVRRRGHRCSLTVKSGAGLTRVEEEIEIDDRRFDSLWALTVGRRLCKQRARVALPDGLIAEVDVYEGDLAGLVTAEVEFDSEPASVVFEVPHWMGCDVTDDSRYRNQSLARDGLPRKLSGADHGPKCPRGAQTDCRRIVRRSS